MNPLVRMIRKSGKASPSLKIGFNNDSKGRIVGKEVASTFTPGFETYVVKPGNVTLGYGVKIT